MVASIGSQVDVGTGCRMHDAATRAKIWPETVTKCSEREPPSVII